MNPRTIVACLLLACTFFAGCDSGIGTIFKGSATPTPTPVPPPTPKPGAWMWDKKRQDPLASPVPR